MHLCSNFSIEFLVFNLSVRIVVWTEGKRAINLPIISVTKLYLNAPITHVQQITDAQEEKVSLSHAIIWPC